jgi:hypothetical protein
MHIQSTTFLLVLLLDLHAGWLAPNHNVGNSGDGHEKDFEEDYGLGPGALISFALG